MKTTRIVWLSFLLLVFLAALPCSARTWTSSDGIPIEGDLVEVEGNVVILRTQRGLYKVLLNRLSPQDQAHIRAVMTGTHPTAVAARQNLRTVGNFDTLKPGAWPTSASLDRTKLTVDTVTEANGTYIYRSPHFEFHSTAKLTPLLVREFCEIFEATFALTKAIPIGLDPRPREGGRYITRLYTSQEEYHQHGGLPGSAGMFRFSSQANGGMGEVHVPLPNLGVNFKGASAVVDRTKSNDTLIHEIAHQMTGRWLPITPVWFSEGLAEFVASQRYHDGRFNLTIADRAVRERVARDIGGDGRQAIMVSPRQLMSVSSAQWNAANAMGANLNYPSANLLFTYFLRIEGDGKGTRLINYLKALSSGTPEPNARAEILMAGKTFDEIEAELAKGWRNRGMLIEFR